MDYDGKILLNKTLVSESGTIRSFDMDDTVDNISDDSTLFSYKDTKLKYVVIGNQNMIPVLTLHDIGQDYSLCYEQFFNYPPISQMISHMCFYHLTLPGQHSEDLNIYQPYPSFDSIAECILEFIKKVVNRNSVVGIGVGAGANILIRCALLNKSIFEGLMFINATHHRMGWIEWINLKRSLFHVDEFHLTSNQINFVMNHYFGDSDNREFDTYAIYRKNLQGIKNHKNLLLLLESYASRTAINLERPKLVASNPNHGNHIKCPVLTIVSNKSPDFDNCLDTFHLFNPASSELIIINEGHGLVLNELPHKVATPMFFFFQGLGHLNNIRPPNL